MNLAECFGPHSVRVFYRNHAGVEAWRHIYPLRLWRGCTDWHHEPQWLLDVFDLDKNAERTFAMKDILKWGEGEPHRGENIHRVESPSEKVFGEFHQGSGN